MSHLLRALEALQALGVHFVERVQAGLRNARAKGKRIGRPYVIADGRRIATLRKAGRSWSEVCEETGLSKGTAQRALRSLPKNDLRYVSATAAD